MRRWGCKKKAELRKTNLLTTAWSQMEIYESESDSNSKEGQEEADTRRGGLDLKDSWPIGYDDKQMLMVHFDW